jgi:hypothetical protein
MERYFCASCEGVSVPGREPMPKNANGMRCPFCGSNQLRVWKPGEDIPDYHGELPYCDAVGLCAEGAVCFAGKRNCRFAPERMKKDQDYGCDFCEI